MNRLIVSLALGSVIAVGCTTEDDSLSTGTGVTVVSTTVTETSTTAPAGPETTTGEVEAATTSSPETTAPPPPETSGPETTVAPETTAAPATTLPPSSTLTDPTQTMWIAGTEEGDPEAVSDGTNCLPFYEAFGVGTLSYAACGPWNSSDGTYVWTVVKGVSGRFFAVVWQPIDTFDWIPKLRLLEPAAGTWDSVIIKAADIDSGPNEELVSGIRLSGSGGHLALDVIDINSGDPAVVAALPALESATAFTEDSLGVWIWLPNFEPGDPLCCPSSWSQFLLSRVGPSWIVSEGIAGAPIEAIPQPSDF
jgi:hypothetical protein